MTKTMSLIAARQPGREARRIAATLLRGLSVALDRLARRLASVPTRPQRTMEALSSIEFYAEAGAPEGALFVDGELVGHVPGVTRL